MGFLDSLLGRSKVKGPAPDRMFAITTAQVTLSTQLNIASRGKAAIVFQPLSTGDFERVATEIEELVRATGAETGTTVETTADSFGYRWFVLADEDVEDLAVGVNAVSDALAVGGYSDRVLCAVFAFQGADAKPLYFIYNYKRGTWYPFVPADGEQQRSSERELQLQAQLGSELPFEADLARWFPLWGIPI